MLNDLVGGALGKMGYDVRSVDGTNMGGVQSIMVQPQTSNSSASSAIRIYRAGSDHRKDGEAVGW